MSVKHGRCREGLREIAAEKGKDCYTTTEEIAGGVRRVEDSLAEPGRPAVLINAQSEFNF